MVYLHEILDVDALKKMVEACRIDVKSHPELPLEIYNYSKQATYINEWTHEEQVCRGLIVHKETGEIIARGPKKFYNYGQPGSPEIGPDTLVRVTTKEDGSLGIPWWYDGHYGVATRGSFISDQAIKASSMENPVLKAKTILSVGIFTPIAEIIYPEGRIVVDYKDEESLRPLGYVDLETGLIYREAKVMTLSDALQLPIGDNEEGFVLDILDKDFIVTGHVKIKGDAYLRLHKIMTNTSARQLWIELAARELHGVLEGKNWAKLGQDPADFERVDTSVSLEDFIGDVPDEFRIWVDKTLDEILESVSNAVEVADSLARVLRGMNPKDQFDVAKNFPMAKEIMAALRENPKASDMILTKAWALARPSHELPFSTGFDN